MNNCFISLVTKLDGWPTCFVKDCLPNIFVDVCLSVHDATINQDYRVRVRHLRDVNENLLEVHLEFHEEFLEFNGLDKVHIGRVDTSSSLLQNWGSFRNLKHAVTHLVQDERKFGKGGRFSGTGTASETDAYDFLNLTGLACELFLKATWPLLNAERIELLLVVFLQGGG